MGGVLLLSLVAVLLAAATPPSGVAAPTGALSEAPSQLVAVAREAGRLTAVDPDILLAVSKIECNFGRCRSGQPDNMVPADVRSLVDQAALKAGGSTAVMLGLADGRNIGDWVNPHPVAGGQHAMGFMQFLPTTWREEVAAAPGRPSDPYKPFDSMVVAGSYLARLQTGTEDGRRHSLHGALSIYGGSSAYADQVLDIVRGSR